MKITINSDPDNPRNLLLICAECSVLPVRSGTTLNRILELVGIHMVRDHPKNEEQKIEQAYKDHDKLIANPYPELWDEGCH